MYLIWFMVPVIFLTWSFHPISASNRDISKFTQDENDILAELEKEVKKYRNFTECWGNSKSILNDRKASLIETYRKPKKLNKGEILMLICYCLDTPRFYDDLNTDLREYDGKKYPVATKVLKEAIYKLMKHQKLPTQLYRSEPQRMMSTYEDLNKNKKSGVLKQFTSTSESIEVAKDFRRNSKMPSMIIKFKDPEVGADVSDFSMYDESEVLLPVSAVYTVITAIKNENNHFNVVLSGPRISTNIGTSDNNVGKFNSNVFIITVSVLIINFV